MHTTLIGCTTLSHLLCRQISTNDPFLKANKGSCKVDWDIADAVSVTKNGMDLVGGDEGNIYDFTTQAREERGGFTTKGLDHYCCRGSAEGLLLLSEHFKPHGCIVVDITYRQNITGWQYPSFIWFPKSINEWIDPRKDGREERQRAQRLIKILRKRYRDETAIRLCVIFRL